MKKIFISLMLLFSSILFAQEKLILNRDFDFESEFYITEITPDIFARIKGKSFKNNCPLKLSELSYLRVLHKTLDGKTLQGELICSRKIDSILLKIFKELYKNNYPIEKIRLVDEYDANDEKSMRDNNTSCFNFRFISNSTKISKHGYGLAVDLNPLYNPYHRVSKNKTFIEPATALPYTNRQKDFEYKIDKNDLAYKLFTKNGFEWGGDWTIAKDYQHFEWKE